MSHATGLKCRECGTETPIAPLHVCEHLLRTATRWSTTTPPSVAR